MDAERLQVERDAAKEEALRLLDENRKLKNQDAEIAALHRDLRKVRWILREIVRVIVAPMSKWARGRRLIDGNLPLFNSAAEECSLLDAEERAEALQRAASN